MQRPRSFRARRLWLSAGVAVLLPQAAGAAAFLPGNGGADPPTGETTSAPPAVLPNGNGNGNGIRWELAPWRHQGSITLDLRRLRLDDGQTTTQGLVFSDVDFASYVWQPWFVRLRFGFGLLAGRDVTSNKDAPSDHQTVYGATGRFGVSVFPASRFPFELRGDVSDSRTGGDTLGRDYRSTRIGMSQAYRPETGNDNYNVNVDHSRLKSFTGEVDTLTAVNGMALRQFRDQALEFGAVYSENERQDTGDRNTLGSLSARHSFHPRSRLNVETLATWNEATVASGGAEATSGVRQITTFANWSPSEGEPLYTAGAPVSIAGSARWVEAVSGGTDGDRTANAFNATLGATQDLTRSWRLSASAAAGRVDSGAGVTNTSGSANLGATWSPMPVPLGDWRWVPAGAGSIGVTRGGSQGNRHIEGLQLSHTVSRDVALAETEALAFSLSQSAAVLAESPGARTTRSVANSGSLFWQSAGEGRNQSFAGVSASDSRNWAEDRGRFQIVNVQWNQRLQFSRFTSGAAEVTLQGSRNDSTQVDAFTGVRREQQGGWQRFYTASVSFENQRVYGVPRLRYSLLASANSQQLERRAFGDVDAPRERISKSIENRLDYSIGRLELRLSARAAQVDDRTVLALRARAQRRF